MTATITWAVTITAASSIAHGGETRGTITLLRRELVVQPDGHAVYVPVISGNAFRGRLRRIGEELTRDILQYEGQLPLAAAHALRSGGSLAKASAEPLSGQKLHQLRSLVPQIGVFGAAVGGRIIDGCLQVGKVLPHVAECAHLIPAARGAPPAFTATQIETFIRQDDSYTHDFAAALAIPGASPEPGAGPGLLMMYRIETFPAGTTFSSWLQLTRATPLEVAFFTDVLRAFTDDGRLGGRAATGHGKVICDLHVTDRAGTAGPADWRAHLTAHRGEALAALRALT
jgi:hypothetical protein